MDGKEKYIRDIEGWGFIPTQKMVSNIKRLEELTHKSCSLSEIHKKYRSLESIDDPEVKDCVKEIAQECKKQEILMMEIKPTLELNLGR